MLAAGKLKRNFVMLAIATICSKCIGFLREILSAQQFGLSNEFDIYLSVFVVPGIIISLLTYAVPNIIIPKLNRNMDDPTFYRYFASHFFTPYVLFLIFIVIVYHLFIGSYINILAFSHEQTILALKLGRLLSIYVFFESFFNLLMTLYNSKEKFILPAFLHLTLQSSVILFMLLFSKRVGVVSICYGLAFGAVLESLLFLVVLKKQSILKYFTFKMSYTPNLFSNIFVVLIIEALGQFYTFSDRIYVTYLPQGYITGLYYANIVKELPFTVLGITLGGILLPKIVRVYQNNDYIILDGLMRKILLYVFLLASFIALFLILGNNYIISLLFERGAFSSNDTSLSSHLLSLFAIGLPFMFIQFIIINLYYTLKLERYIFYFSILSVLLKCFLSFCFVQVGYYEGLALSTSIAYMFSASLFIVMYFIKIHPYLEGRRKIL